MSPLPDRGKPVARGQREELLPVLVVDRTSPRVEGVGLLGLQVSKRLLVAATPRVDRNKLHIESPRDNLGLLERTLERGRRVVEHPDPPRGGDRLLEQLETFGEKHALRRVGNAGDITSGARQTLHISSFDRGRTV